MILINQNIKNKLFYQKRVNMIILQRKKIYLLNREY